ncbi:hypothetical protein JM18_009101 [Phytophthora kernoviae]|uniref:non-specific serine/threonine protein kinase n=1 Tax=Phytophthora kernoviae TaxID=325452 RepID=A0A921S8U3_9STRA|nr:hypothetical protein JM18_009101 [Phytophthora kernoviae]
MENYHILERIGEGSFGKVYRGRRKYSGHIVALKFVTKRGKSARDLDNLRQEINILRRLNHCNIIAMMDSFETEGEFCMVTEYAQGELFQVLEDEHSLPEEEIRKIAIQLIQALHVLHSNRIIHRDMKPQNILIGSKQQIKLADFGFARAISHDSSLLRSIKGTPLYMAPELVQEKPYNYTVDLWSLGVILYELAVGRPPFYTDRIVTLIQMIVREPVKYPPTMSASFQSFLKGLLNKDPARRITWPDILHHPFVQETPEQLEARLQLERQVRALPRFFKATELHLAPESESEEKIKPSIERLRACDEWKICDPETGRQLASNEAPRDDTPNPTRQTSTSNENNNNESSPPNEGNKHEPLPPSNTGSSGRSVILEAFHTVWDRINKELDIQHVEAGLLGAPLFANAICLLPSMPINEISGEVLTKVDSLLHFLYRSLVMVLKVVGQFTQLKSLLQIKDNVHRFLGILVENCTAIQTDDKLVSEVLYKAKHRNADIFTILLWGLASSALHQIEQYFATEFLSVILRRGVLPKHQVWRCAQTLFPLLSDASDIAVLSALSTFFAEVIESCHIDESALTSDGELAELRPQDEELWNLVVRGALTLRCSDSIFRLFSNNILNEDGDPDASSKAQLLTSYNIRAQGLLDSGIVFLLRVASKAAAQSPLNGANGKNGGENPSRSEEMKMFMSVFKHDRVWGIFDDMMTTGGVDFLSPWGLFCFLKLLRIVREIQCNEAQMEVAVNEHLLLHLVNLLDLKHIEYLFRWPEVVGGGSNAVKALVHATVKVLGIPFAHSVSEELLVDTQEILYDAKCVQKLLGVLGFVVSTKELHLEASVLELPISFLSRLVTSSTHFGSQFVEAKGMLVIKECGMLRSSCSPSLIIDTLLIVSQLARSSQDNYKCILEADLLSEFYELMQHSEAMVRAKALNCIGNLCRHSTLFYSHFLTPLGGSSSSTILAGMIQGLSDPDSYVRRFACFAIGNAAFHSDELYDALQPAIPLLVQNLRNEEEKTRSNAGGALGNLVRNSDKLCGDLCVHKAPWELFELAMTDSCTASRRIVLFSLGNFCVYPQCFNFLVDVEPGFVGELEHLYDEVVADEVSRRNIRRILAKIEALTSEDSGEYIGAE